MVLPGNFSKCYFRLNIVHFNWYIFFGEKDNHIFITFQFIVSCFTEIHSYGFLALNHFSRIWLFNICYQSKTAIWGYKLAYIWTVIWLTITGSLWCIYKRNSQEIAYLIYLVSFSQTNLYQRISNLTQCVFIASWSISSDFYVIPNDVNRKATS